VDRDELGGTHAAIRELRPDAVGTGLERAGIERAGEELDAVRGERRRAPRRAGHPVEPARDRDPRRGEHRPEPRGELQDLLRREGAVLLDRGGREQHRARRPPARPAHLAPGGAVRVQHPLEREARDDALGSLHLAGLHPGRDHDRAGGELARPRRLVEPDRAERARPRAGVARLARAAQARGGVDGGGVRERAWVRDPDRLPRRSAVGVRARDGAGRAAGAAAEAPGGIDAARGDRDVDLEPAVRATHAADLRAGQHLDALGVQHLVEHRLHEAARALARREDLVEAVGEPAEREGALDEDDLAVAPGEGPRSRDAGDAPAHHDHVRRDRHVRGGDGLVQPDAREPRRDEAAGALGGGAGLPADPLDLLAQVHELQVLGRAAHRCEHAAERRLVLPRRAGANDDALEAALADPRREPGLPLRRAEDVVDRHVARARPRGRIPERAELHELAQVRAAATEIDAGGAVLRLEGGLRRARRPRSAHSGAVNQSPDRARRTRREQREARRPSIPVGYVREEQRSDATRIGRRGDGRGLFHSP
jgi:hypothetical protein